MRAHSRAHACRPHRRHLHRSPCCPAARASGLAVCPHARAPHRPTLADRPTLQRYCEPSSHHAPAAAPGHASVLWLLSHLLTRRALQSHMHARAHALAPPSHAKPLPRAALPSRRCQNDRPPRGQAARLARAARAFPLACPGLSSAPYSFLLRPQPSTFLSRAQNPTGAPHLCHRAHLIAAGHLRPRTGQTHPTSGFPLARWCSSANPPPLFSATTAGALVRVSPSRCRHRLPLVRPSPSSRSTSIDAA